MPNLRFGAHMPTSGGVHKAVTVGAAIGCETIQLFTASPRQWKSAPMDDTKVRAFRRAVEKTGIDPLVAHDSYLINLAAKEEDLLEKSREAFLEEMRRAEALGLDYLVTHLGAHTGAGYDAGITRLAQSLDILHRQTEGFRVKVALETTAGQGTTLGGDFVHFPQLFAQIEDVERLRICLDTCHIFVAGYDIRTSETVKQTLDEFDTHIGLHRLAVIHANDAQKGLGSKADRHEHIGCGKIGDSGFIALLNDPRLPENLPVIVETPEKEEKPLFEGKRMLHERNVYKLRRLCDQANIRKLRHLAEQE